MARLIDAVQILEIEEALQEVAASVACAPNDREAFALLVALHQSVEVAYAQLFDAEVPK